MKRINLTILSISVLLFAAIAQKPGKGSLLTEASLNLRSFGTNLELSNGDFNVGSSLRGRYFLKNDLVVRTSLDYSGVSLTENSTENLDGTGGKGSAVSKFSSAGLGLGVEKHFSGNSRFSPFVGGQFGFALGGSKISTDNYNYGTELYQADYTYNEVDKSNNLGIDALIGADYWINRSFYVGTEFGFGFGLSKSKDRDVTVKTGGIESKSITPGGKSTSFGEFIAPSIRLGYALVYKPAGLDSDGDGVIDELDKCNNTAKGVDVDANGCPLVVKEIRNLAKNIYFETSSDKLKPESFKALDKVASLMKLFPDANLSIEGHTDNTGSLDMNMDLSKRRAQSVLNYLKDKGVDVSHLRAEGFGPKQPIANNNTEEGKALNRRVELLVTF